MEDLKVTVIKKLWYIYAVEYYSAIKKEQIWVSCSEVDEPRVSYIEWSKSVKEKQVSNTNTYIWNLEKWDRWTSWRMDFWT